MTKQAQWTTQEERGSVWAIRLIVWLALALGRRVMGVLLAPICLYFMLVPSHWQQASRSYLPRVLGRPPRFIDDWRHCRSFAVCVLDRVYLLRGRTAGLRFQVIGAQALDGRGCLLLGAHLGSFEAVRSAGHRLCEQKLSLVMFEDNARKTGAVLNAINPTLGVEIISLGRPGAMLAVRDRLDDGHLVGVLADRGLAEGKRVRLDFLGTPAWFPEGPFRMAAMLGHPVVFMVGLYRGAGCYDIVFEAIENDGDEAAMMRRYVALLERYCRQAPYNWSNFYDFWA